MGEELLVDGGCDVDDWVSEEDEGSGEAELEGSIQSSSDEDDGSSEDEVEDAEEEEGEEEEDGGIVEVEEVEDDFGFNVVFKGSDSVTSDEGCGVLIDAVSAGPTAPLS